MKIINLHFKKILLIYIINKINNTTSDGKKSRRRKQSKSRRRQIRQRKPKSKSLKRHMKIRVRRRSKSKSKRKSKRKLIDGGYEDDARVTAAMIRQRYPSFRGLNDEDVFKYFIMQSKDHPDPTVRVIGNELEKLVRTKGAYIPVPTDTYRSYYDKYKDDTNLSNKYSKLIIHPYYGNIIVFGILSKNPSFNSSLVYIFVSKNISLTDIDNFIYKREGGEYTDMPDVLKSFNIPNNIKEMTRNGGKYYGWDDLEHGFSQQRLSDEMIDVFKEFEEYISEKTKLNLELERLKSIKKDIESLEYKDKTEKLELEKINEKIKKIEEYISNDPNM